MRSVTLPAVLALLGTAAPAWAVGNLADVNIIDRDTGQRQQAHYHNGEYWVAGRPGAHYAIQIQNQLGQRLMAVTSVDGVNVVSGETAAVNQTGYVFHAWQAYDIAGWRKSNAEIAAFTFTSIPKSYAARTGRPQNVGVIGVALFRERYVPPPPPVGNVAPAAPAAARERSDAAEQELAEAPVTGTRAQPPAGAAGPGGGAPRGGGARAGGAGGGSGKAEQSRSSPSLGTGHGRREASAVVNVAFERAQETPDEVIRIRYDSRDNLVAMGVIPPAPQPPPLDPFPHTPDRRYVPDP
jgi:hypothetical protein